MPAILVWLSRLLPTNPICLRLVQGGSRRTRHLLIRGAYLGLLMVLLFFALLGQEGSMKELAQRGAGASTLAAFAQVGLICILTPIFMAGAIAQESSPRTWEILLTTPLNALQIVLGSLFGRLFFVFGLLLAALPLFITTQAFGGVPGEAIVASTWVAAASAMVMGAVAVALSVVGGAGKRSVFIFYAAVLVYLFATWAVDLLLREPVAVGSTATFTTVTTPLNPFLVLESVLMSNSYQPHELAGTGAGALTSFWFGRPVAAYGWLCIIVTTVLIAASTLSVRRIGSRAVALPLWRRLFGKATSRSERAARKVGTNPVAWRERHLRSGSAMAMAGRWAFFVLGLLSGFVLLILHWRGTLDSAQLRVALGALLGAETLVVLFTAINLSATAVSREREDGTLDLILTTPIQPGPYLSGKLLGLFEFLLPMILVPPLTLALAAIYVLGNGFGVAGGVSVTEIVGTTRVEVPLILPEGAITFGAVFVAFTAFCIMVGLQWSIRSKGTIGSTLAAVGVTLAVAGVLGLCGGAAGASIPVVGAVMVALSPVNLLAAVVSPGWAVSGSLEDPVAARTALLVGSAIAVVAFLAVVVGMHMTMKRSFMFTVRKLAGTN
ncbi:MAG: hypothetical protein KF724_01355 [Phycisphaeraceae bacterium]|nr:hypothetical protein [Phycisphaeraceae bacterium]